MLTERSNGHFICISFKLNGGGSFLVGAEQDCQEFITPEVDQSTFVKKSHSEADGISELTAVGEGLYKTLRTPDDLELILLHREPAKRDYDRAETRKTAERIAEGKRTRRYKDRLQGNPGTLLYTFERLAAQADRSVVGESVRFNEVIEVDPSRPRNVTTLALSVSPRDYFGNPEQNPMVKAAREAVANQNKTLSRTPETYNTSSLIAPLVLLDTSVPSIEVQLLRLALNERLQSSQPTFTTSELQIYSQRTS